MKTITRTLLILFGSGMLFFACSEDPIDQNATDVSSDPELPEVVVSETNNDSVVTPEIPEDFVKIFQDSLTSIQNGLDLEGKNPVATYKVFDADRCTDDANFKGSSFWWPEDVNRILFEEFYTNDETYPLTFTEFDDGTALMVGVTNAFRAECSALLYVWIKNKRNFEQWTEIGGSFKEEGCSEAVGEDLDYYVVDQENSYMVSLGGDCYGEGVYGFEQRPNPDNPATDNFGVAVGPGGALWDSSVGDIGLAGWSWITNIETGERLWESDFNFTMEADGPQETICTVSDANRCSEENPNTNFWWPRDSNVIDFDEFYDTDTDSDYTFTEFPDGTAHIVGRVNNIMDDLECSVEIDVWLKDRKTWEEWQASGGEFKDEGCSEADPANLHYYVIDAERSSIVSNGSDCIVQGTYSVSQRPDPNDPETPNFGVAVGPGGALWDDRPDQNGLAGWLFIRCVDTGEVWDADFNFTIDCDN